MISTEDEQLFLEYLRILWPRGKKLVFGSIFGNQVWAKAEIRCFVTATNYPQFALAPIDYMNRRGSGVYTFDNEEMYLRALDMERSYAKARETCTWYAVDDCEHTPDVSY